VAYFPLFYAIYGDDLINKLRCSGYGVHIGSVFAGSLFLSASAFLIMAAIQVVLRYCFVLYCIVFNVDDIVLLSPSCYDL